jgi:hypothetical protein
MTRPGTPTVQPRDVVAGRGEVAASAPTLAQRRRRRLRRAMAVAFVGVVAAGLAGALVGRDGGDQPGEAQARAAVGVVPAVALPSAPAPAMRIPAPAELTRTERGTAQWAPVLRSTIARTAPGTGRATISRVGTRTPEGTANILEVIGRRRDAAGALWVQVRLAVLPNGTRGWVPRTALGGLSTVNTHLVVNLSERKATLVRDGRIVLRVPVGVGRAGTPTPTGSFYIRNRLTKFASPTYGPVAFGTSARSAQLTDWPAGGFVGIHGTDQPGELPGRVSHGCIRMRNADILKLA